MKREDDFKQRRKHLTELTDAELHSRFWVLAEQLVEPLLELAKKHTTPSIERSVLMRMGFSSMEAKAIVNGIIDQRLMGKGAGHVILKLARAKRMSIRQAGLALAEGHYLEELPALFRDNRA